MLTRGLAAAVAAAFISLSSLARAEDDGWVQDLTAAKETAAKDGKDLLIDFTGSDWCIWCKRLDQEVFGTDEFKAAAPKDFVLVKLDFPQDETLVTKEIKEQNQKLAKEWGIQGFPTIMLADATGRPYAKTGYDKGGPEPYLAKLAELKGKHATRDEALKAAEGKRGVERAKALDQALATLDEEVVMQHYGKEIDEIADLAKDDAELAKKYGALKETRATNAAMMEIETAMQEHAMKADWAGVITAMDGFVEKYKDKPAIVQHALMQKSFGYHETKDLDTCIKTLEAALAADPTSPMSDQLKAIIEQVKSEKEGGGEGHEDGEGGN